MFYKGKQYKVLAASDALKVAVTDYIRERMPAGLDALEKYEAIQIEMETLRLCRFMVKHLIPDFPQDDVTMETKDFLFRMIHLKHAEPDREAAIEQRDFRRWCEAQGEVPAGVSGSADDLGADGLSKDSAATEVRAQGMRFEMYGLQ